MKRFEQWNQGYRKTESRSSASEQKTRPREKDSFDHTKKNLGFNWDIPHK